MFQQQKARKNSAFKMENINKNMKSMLYVYIYICGVKSQGAHIYVCVGPNPRTLNNQRTGKHFNKGPC